VALSTIVATPNRPGNLREPSQEFDMLALADARMSPNFWPRLFTQ
jgi:hypothetical protein